MHINGKALPEFQPVWYTPEMARDLSPRPEFQVIGLPGIELGDVDFVQSPDGTNRFSGRSLAILLRAGLLNWRGLVTADGQPIEWQRDIEANLRRLDLATTINLAVRIWELSKVMEDEEKNSESPPMSRTTEGNSTATVASGGGDAAETGEPSDRNG